MHTGGDLSLPADVRAVVQPAPLPLLDSHPATEAQQPPE
jgi:hypothetical protein